MSELRKGPINGPEPAWRLNHLIHVFDGATYFVPKYARHRPACQAILKNSYYEPETHAFVHEFFKGRPAAAMIHAGTFFGDMLPSFSRATSGRIYAFEPDFENYTLARLCVEANGLDRVVLFHAALARTIGNLRFEAHASDGRHLGGAAHVAQTGRIVPSLSIDALRIGDVGLIHLDVEGQEREVLEGALETLQRCRPVVLVENNGHTCGPVLRSAGYRFDRAIPGQMIFLPL